MFVGMLSAFQKWTNKLINICNRFFNILIEEMCFGIGLRVCWEEMKKVENKFFASFTGA
jgi:hypothetical protein